jgi:hypothetical protein
VDDSSECIALNYISFISWLCILLQGFFFSQIPFSVFNFPTYPEFFNGLHILTTYINNMSLRAQVAKPRSVPINGMFLGAGRLLRRKEQERSSQRHT